MADKPREAVLADYVRTLLFHYENCKDLSEFGPYLEQCGEDPAKVLVEIAGILESVWKTRQQVCYMCKASNGEHLRGCPKGTHSLEDERAFRMGVISARMGQGVGTHTDAPFLLGHKRGLEEPGEPVLKGLEYE